MTKKYKQQLHRNYMDLKMQSVFTGLGLSYCNFGTIKNKAYWFEFSSKLTDNQKLSLKESHIKPELVNFGIRKSEYAPEIGSNLMFLNYD